MNSTISVIIPAYNLEGLISKSLDSVIKQDYEEIEIILVNDASSDRTEEEAEKILSESGRKYRIISLVKNSGVSAARNRGIEAASGKYLLFFDGDDLCEQYMVSSLVKCAEAENNADLTISGYRNYYSDTGISADKPLCYGEKLRSMSIQSAVAARILNKFEPSLCTLYRTAFIRENGINYSEGCNAGEDGEFFLKALIRADKMAVCDEISYIYVHHSKMGSNEKIPEKRIKRYEANANAVFRTYRDISEFATEKELVRINKYLLRTEAYFRLLSSAAQNDDREKFDFIRKSEMAKELLSSVRVFFIKPEYFIKAVFFLLFPDLYYRHYKKRFRK